MEAEVINIDQWIAENVPQEVEYAAQYNPDTGAIIGVGPDHFFAGKPNILPIDHETATMIIEGKIALNTCFADIASGSVVLTEHKTIFKIDDVLHRVISKEYADFDKPTIYIVYKDNKLTFELTEEYSGTYKQDEKYQPVKKRKFSWDGETQMDFLLTEYNDPNVLYEMISVKLSDLIGNKVEIEVNDLPEKFSLYTRRIFKNYVIDYQ